MAATRRSEKQAEARDALRRQVLALQSEIAGVSRVPARIMAADWHAAKTWKDETQRVMACASMMVPPKHSERPAKLRKLVERLQQARSLLIDGRTVGES